MGGAGSGRRKGARDANGMTALQSKCFHALMIGISIKEFSCVTGANYDTLRSAMSEVYREHGVRSALALVAKLRKAP